MPALLQAFLRLVALKRLGVLLFVLAATLCASSTASALEPTQTKTCVWGFDFAEHNSDGLLSAATHGKHQGNRAAPSEVASGSLLAAEGGETVLYRLITDADSEANFVSNAAKGLAPRGPEAANPLIHGGLSMFDSLEGAAAKVPILERGGRTVLGIGEVRIPAGAADVTVT